MFDREPEAGVEKSASPAQHDSDNDSDSDSEAISVIIPCIEEQRKFAEVASCITRLQKFQAAADKMGLGNALWKGYVLDYEQAWATADASVREQGEGLELEWLSGSRKERENSCRSRGGYDGHDQGRNRTAGKGEHRWKGHELEMNQERDVHKEQGGGLVMDRGRVDVMTAGREINRTGGRGIEMAREREAYVFLERERNIGRGTEASGGEGFGRGKAKGNKRGF